jgi:formate dehydrogenase major subunit
LIGFVADPNVAIQESKALTGMIETGRRSKNRRGATTSFFGRPLHPDAKKRDLPEARHKPETKHGYKAQSTKEGN